MYPRATTALVLAAVLFLCAAPLFARERLFLTGAEGGDGKSYNYYTFAAVVMPAFGGRLGGGPVQKYWVDFGGYRYRSGDATIDATAVGAEAALGYQASGPKGWSGAYLGVRYSHTALSPDNPDSRVRGDQVRPTLQLEGEGNLAADWRVNGIARYVPVSDAYWTRGRIMYRLREPIFTGPEIVAHGDPDYRAWQLGWFVAGFRPVPDSGLGFKLGVRKTEKEPLSEYAGIEFSKSF